MIVLEERSQETSKRSWSGVWWYSTAELRSFVTLNLTAASRHFVELGIKGRQDAERW